MKVDGILFFLYARRSLILIPGGSCWEVVFGLRFDSSLGNSLQIREFTAENVVKMCDLAPDFLRISIESQGGGGAVG